MLTSIYCCTKLHNRLIPSHDLLAAVNRFSVVLVCRLSVLAEGKGAFKGELSETTDKSTGGSLFVVGT